MASRKILITGATGYVGRKLIERLQGSADELHVFQRGEADLPNTFVHRGDLRDPDPFGSVPKNITHIVHTAAVTRFNVEEDLANQVNIQGSEKLLAFAKKCPALEQVLMLGTVYASGKKRGVIAEERLDNSAGFANHYERSKWEMEERIFSESSLPWRLLRIATAVADDAQGNVTQYNAVHNTLKLFYYGLMSLIPGKPETPLYFITGDFSVQSVQAVLDRGEAQQIYQAVHTKAESIRLGQFLDAAFACFQEDQDFRAKNIMKPLYSDEEAFEILSSGMRGFGSAVTSQAFSSVSPFAAQLFIDKEFSNSRLRAIFPNYQAPDPERLLRKVCQNLVKTKWGKIHEYQR